MKWLLILSILFSATTFGQDSKSTKVDSLLSIYSSNAHDTTRFKAANQLTSFYAKNRNYQEAFDLATELVASTDSLIKTAKLKEDEIAFVRNITASSYINLATVLVRTGNFPDATKNCETGLEIAKEIENNKSIATAYNVQATILAYQGRIPEGLEYFLLALKVREEAGDEAGAAASYNNIGNIYAMLSEYDKAIEYFEKSLAYKEKVGDEFGIARTQMNLGAVNRDRGTYAQSHEYLLQALDYFSREDYPGDVAGIHMNLGHLYTSHGNYHLALDYYDSALVVYQQLGNIKVVSQAYNSKGGVYFYLKEYDSAQVNYLQSYEISEQIGDMAMRSFNLSNLAGNDLTFAVEYEDGEKERDSLLASAKKRYEEFLSLELQTGRKAAIANAYMSSLMLPLRNTIQREP